MGAPVETIEGLPTDGPMGKAPTITVGSVMTAVAVLVGILGQLGVYTPTPDQIAFAQDYGKLGAGVLVGGYTFIQALILYGRVFAPNSVATRYVRKFVPGY